MKIKIVYFVYLKPNGWEDIVLEQLNSLKSSDLYDMADNIYICGISSDNEIDKLNKLLKNNFNKIELLNFSDENYFEFNGFKTIFEVAEDNSLLLYFHTKGITSGGKNNLIRQLLFKYTIENYKLYLDNFEESNFDIGGVFPHKRGFVFYNFFWINGQYVKKYCNPPKINTNRFFWEEYIGNPYSNKENIMTYSPIIQYEKIGDKDTLYKLRDSLL